MKRGKEIMKREPIDLSNTEYIPIEEVPIRAMLERKWLTFFGSLTEGKAALLKYNNRQRVHQVRATILYSAGYHKLRGLIKTRVMHGTPEIHGTDDWLLYVWKITPLGE